MCHPCLHVFTVLSREPEAAVATRFHWVWISMHTEYHASNSPQGGLSIPHTFRLNQCLYFPESRYLFQRQ